MLSIQTTDIHAMNVRKLESSTPINGLDGVTVDDYWARAYSDVLYNMGR